MSVTFLYAGPHGADVIADTFNNNNL